MVKILCCGVFVSFGYITCSSRVYFKFLMFSNDTLLYLEGMPAAQTAAILHPGRLFLGLNSQSEQVTGVTLVSTLEHKCLNLGLMSLQPKCLSNVWRAEGACDCSCSSGLVWFWLLGFFFFSVFLQFVSIYFDVTTV